MPPDRPPLPASILAALGLVSVSGCGPCLDVAVEHSGSHEHSGTVTQPCLMFLPHTGHSAAHGSCLTGLSDTGVNDDSGGSGHQGGSGAAARIGTAPLLFERLSADGVLPPDVVERLGRRGLR